MLNYYVHVFSEEVSCEKYGMSNGVVWFSGIKPGDVAIHTCTPGYLLIGKEIRECHGNGTWSNVLPVCQEGTYESYVTCSKINT